MMMIPLKFQIYVTLAASVRVPGAAAESRADSDAAAPAAAADSDARGVAFRHGGTESLSVAASGSES